ncbi:hypothetical protein HK405_006179 [Cladochytrium tenue]|nr:hypothetical protein HK405_006179 [Cladochytrium tenue]
MEFAGKNVLIVDDSIVRGTTSREIVQMARESGARKVYFASCSPAIRFPNVYGIDMPTRQELIAHNRTEDEIAKVIGADCVIYQDLEDLVNAVAKGSPHVHTFDLSVFNGSYITEDVSEQYMLELELQRSGSVQSLLAADETLGLYNGFGHAFTK